jgi:NDP-sugar pyrophosphorylase family protein
MGFDADQYYWRDLGRPENVAQAEKDIANKLISV